MTQLNITERPSGDVTILDLEGDLIIFNQGSAALRQAIRRLLETGRKKIIINFAKVKFVDSSGIGALLSSYVTLKQAGGQLKLFNVTEHFQQVLKITRLLPILDIYDDEAQAINASK